MSGVSKPWIFYRTHEGDRQGSIHSQVFQIPDLTTRITATSLVSSKTINASQILFPGKMFMVSVKRS